jgi:hypothetical protein
MTSAASPTPSPKNSISNQGGLIAKQPLGSRLSVQRDAIFILLNQVCHFINWFEGILIN